MADFSSRAHHGAFVIARAALAFSFATSPLGLVACTGTTGGPDVVGDSSWSDREDTTDASADVQEMDDSTFDAATDTSPWPDVTTDGGPAPIPTAPIIVSVSSEGHDRFYGVAFDRNEHIYAVGQVADSIETTANYATIVARFDLAGRLDSTWGEAGIARVDIVAGTNGEIARGIVVQSSGRVVISATVDLGGDDARDRDIALVRFDESGHRDATFGSNGVAILDLGPGISVGSSYVADSAWGLAVQSDDRLVVSGSRLRSETGATDSDFVTVRVLANGARDTSFATDGVFALDVDHANASARGVSVLSDGRIVAAGYMPTDAGNVPVVYRLTSAGALDTTFGNGGYFNTRVLTAQTETYAVAVQGDRLVTTGYGRETTDESLDWLSLRITANGALDTTWGTNGSTRLDFAGFADNSRHLVVLPDDRVLLFGGARPVADNADAAFALLTANGALDTTFGDGGKRMLDLGGANDFLWSGAVSVDGARIAFAGVRGVVSGSGGNDDAALVILAMPE